jgi:hypothetical protein
MTRTHHIEIHIAETIDFLSYLSWRKIGEVVKTPSTAQLRNRRGVQKPLDTNLIGIDNTESYYTIGWFGNIGKI